MAEQEAISAQNGEEIITEYGPTFTTGFHHPSTTCANSEVKMLDQQKSAFEVRQPAAGDDAQRFDALSENIVEVERDGNDKHVIKQARFTDPTMSTSNVRTAADVVSTATKANEISHQSEEIVGKTEA